MIFNDVNYYTMYIQFNKYWILINRIHIHVLKTFNSKTFQHDCRLFSLFHFNIILLLEFETLLETTHSHQNRNNYVKTVNCYNFLIL